MPKYIVAERSLVGNRIYEAGEEVDYDGLPAENLRPTCDEGRARTAEYQASNAERVKAMLAANAGGAGAIDPAVFAAAVAAAVKEAMAAQGGTTKAAKN